MTTLSVDSTCIDYLIPYCAPDRNRGFRTRVFTSLFEQDLQISRDTFRTAAIGWQEWLAVLAEIRYESFTNPLLDGSEILEAVFMKSDHQLRDLLHQSRCLHTLNADMVVDVLIMSTITGWMDGCRVLLNADLVGHLEDPSSDAWRPRQTLLTISAVTNRLDMLQFWLSQREMCDEPLLSLIGHIEDALHLNEEMIFEVPMIDVLQLVSSHLLKQRHEVKLLMEKHELQYCCERAQISFPDAHVGCMLAALVNEGVDVPRRYWPRRKSLYYMQQIWEFDELVLCRAFELAGIRDISQENFRCDKETSCSPLVYLATQLLDDTRSMCLAKRNLTVRWFLSRGANMRETWPGTATTALHCLAWQSAEHLQLRVDFTDFDHPPMSPIMQDTWTYEDYELLVKEEILDECECGCSRSGCDFLSCFWKHTFVEAWYRPRFPLICEGFKNTISARELGNVRVYAPDDHFELRYILFTGIFLDLTLWVEKAATTLALDRIIHVYIRLFVFSYLEIRHTCCDINRIKHGEGSGYREDPDFTEQPYPRYSPKELRRISNEDARLRECLGHLVPKLIAQYDSFGGKLQDFVIEVLIPTMGKTAKELKEEDKTLYAVGRRELGVVMNGDEDETEGESIEVEEEEADAEEDSDDEY